MVAFVYVIPVIACLLLHFEFDYDGEWTTYLWIMFAGEATAGGLHYFFFQMHTSATEYLGSTVSGIYHEDGWTELVERTETKTDSKGNSYTVKRIDEKWHREKYYFLTSLGSRFDCGSDFYRLVERTWKLAPVRVSWRGEHIKHGIRYGTENEFSQLDYSQQENPDYWVPITESNSYCNKIRRSNSIFKFERIDRRQARELGLYDYPFITDFDAPCILSYQCGYGIVDDDVEKLFRKFNARIASQWEMRLYILLFPAEKGIAISEQQRAYWQGGNKNEFVVCVGIDAAGRVEWARTFSWADEQEIETQTSQRLMLNRNLDWQGFYDWLKWHLRDWRRKEFKDFDYINVNLPLWQLLAILLLSTLENALALYLVIN